MAEITGIQKPPGFLSKAAESLRLNLWKFIGALVMEEKNGVQAVSLTKLLALTTYAACMYLWMHVREDGVVTVVPDAMLYTLWALLGINGTSKVAGILKGDNSGAPDVQPNP
jgi:hypothetical protein